MAAPEVDVGGRQIAEAFVTAAVIIVADKVINLRFKIARQVVVLQQDAVLKRLVPTLDLTLGHRVIRRAPWRHLSDRFPVTRPWLFPTRPQQFFCGLAQYDTATCSRIAQSRPDRAKTQHHVAGVVGSNRPLLSTGENDWVVEAPICVPRDGPVCTSACTSWDVGSRADF